MKGLITFGVILIALWCGCVVISRMNEAEETHRKNARCYELDTAAIDYCDVSNVIFTLLDTVIRNDKELSSNILLLSHVIPKGTTITVLTISNGIAALHFESERNGFVGEYRLRYVDVPRISLQVITKAITTYSGKTVTNTLEDCRLTNIVLNTALNTATLLSTNCLLLQSVNQ